MGQPATKSPPLTLPRSALNCDDPGLQPMWKQLARQQVRQGNACPDCLGLEWVRPGEFPIDHPRFGTLERCPACAGGKLPAYLRRVSGLTGWLSSASFDDYVRTNTRLVQLEKTQAICERGYGWLALWGGYGHSKTYLLAAAVNHFLNLHRPAVYVTAGRLLDHLRDAYNPESKVGFSDAFTHWANCQVLAVDEAQAFHQTSWAMDKYRQLLDHRYNLACSKDSITLFACNPKPGGDDWPGELGWLYSRMGHWDIVEAKGGDIRPVLKGEHWTEKF